MIEMSAADNHALGVIRPQVAMKSFDNRIPVRADTAIGGHCTDAQRS